MKDGHVLQVDTPAIALRASARPLRRGLHRLPGDDLVEARIEGDEVVVGQYRIRSPCGDDRADRRA
jgi:hypothetical protein